MLKQAIVELFSYVDFDELANEVRPFLFDPDDARRVRLFREFWEALKL